MHAQRRCHRCPASFGDACVQAAPRARACRRSGRRATISLRSVSRCAASSGRIGSRVGPPGRPSRSSAALMLAGNVPRPKYAAEHAAPCPPAARRAVSRSPLGRRLVERQRLRAEHRRARIDVADRAFAQRREAEEARIAREHADAVARAADDRREQSPVLRALLDADRPWDRRRAGRPSSTVEADAGAARNVVEQDRQRRCRRGSCGSARGSRPGPA